MKTLEHPRLTKHLQKPAGGRKNSRHTWEMMSVWYGVVQGTLDGMGKCKKKLLGV